MRNLQVHLTIISFVLICIIPIVSFAQDQTHTKDVTFTAISPDGKYILTGSDYEDQIKVWDATDGALLKTLKQDDPRGLIFSPDGSKAVFETSSEVGYKFSILNYPEMTIKNCYPEYEDERYSGDDQVDYKAGFTADGSCLKYIRVGYVRSKKGGWDYGSRRVSIMSSDTGDINNVKWKKLIGELPTSSAPTNPKFSSKANRVLISNSGKGQIYEVGKDEPVCEFKTKKFGYNYNLSPDGNFISAVMDGKTNIYSVPQLEPMITLPYDMWDVIHYSSKGDTIYYNNGNKMLIISAKDGTILKEFKHTKSIYHLSIDPMGRFYVCRESDENIVGVYDLETGEEKFKLINNVIVVSYEDRVKQREAEYAETHYNRNVPTDYTMMNTHSMIDFYGHIKYIDYMKQSYISVAAQNKTNNKQEITATFQFEVQKSEYGNSILLQETRTFILKPGEVLIGGDGLAFYFKYKKEKFIKIEVKDLKIKELE